MIANDAFKDCYSLSNTNITSSEIMSRSNVLKGGNDSNYNNESDYVYDYDEPSYGRYSGSYAQDVEGWSDDDIDEVFDGDPDAYWNID